MLRDFIAIDFETANQELSSVCSVGVVMVRDGQVVDSFYSQIQPEPNYYNYLVSASTWYLARRHRGCAGLFQNMAAVGRACCRGILPGPRT